MGHQTAVGLDSTFLDTEVERALDPYRTLLSPGDLDFMRDRLLESVRSGPLRDAARRAAPRIVEESVEAPLSPEAQEAIRRKPLKGTG